MKNKIILGLFLINLAWILPLQAGAVNIPVSGFAWSENIGWTRFNPDLGGVQLDDVGKFSGYAWSRGTEPGTGGVGWISFNRGETGGPPTDDPCVDGSCIAKVDNIGQLGIGDVNVVGWARACGIPEGGSSVQCGGGGWDGWIKFNHNQANKVYIDTNGDFHNYAWSNMVIGAVSFNCKEGGYNEGTQAHYDICGTSNYKVSLGLIPGQKPDKPDTWLESWNHCSYKGFSIPTFSWTYSDPNRDPQDGYEIEIYGEETLLVSSPYASTSYTPSDNLPWIEDNLIWGKTYSWKVRVKDMFNNWSDWSDLGSFGMPAHAYPYADFDPSPEKPVLNQVVQFVNQTEFSDTVCYLDPDDLRCQYGWTFEFGDPGNSTDRQPQTTFTDIGQQGNEVTLTATDSDGYNCQEVKKVGVKLPLPEWKEIPPSGWVNKVFAFLRRI